MRTMLTLSLIVFLAFSVSAQHWQTLTKENGKLPSNVIMNIFFDDDGSVWYCTMDTGLVHASNGEFQFFNSNTDDDFTADHVNAIVKSSAGVYWVATEYEGLFRYQNGVWTQYTSQNTGLTLRFLRNLTLEDGGPSNGGAIWIGTWMNGAFRFDGTHWQQFTVDNGTLTGSSVFDIEIESNPDPNVNEKTIWVATSNGLDKFDGTHWENVPVNGDTTLWINAIALQDGGTLYTKGKMYIGTETGEFMEYDGSTWDSYAISDPWNPNTSVTDIAIDPTGVKWFATDEQGLGMYDGTQLLLYYKNNSGIAGNNVIDLALRPQSDSIQVWCAVYDLDSNRYAGISIYSVPVTGIETSHSLVRQFTLYPNYPNPFNPTTHIRYRLPNRQHVLLQVFDVQGRLVQTLVNGVQPAGEHDMLFNGAGLSSGTYYYRLKTASGIRTGNMTLLK